MTKRNSSYPNPKACNVFKSSHCIRTNHSQNCCFTMKPGFYHVHHLTPSGLATGPLTVSNVLELYLHRSGSVYCLLNLIADIPNVVQLATTGKNAPHLAVETQEHCKVQFLIQAGAQVDAPVLNGCTPIHLRAGWGLNSISSALWDACPEFVQLNMKDELCNDLGENVRNTCSAQQGIPPINRGTSLGKGNPPINSGQVGDVTKLTRCSPRM